MGIENIENGMEFPPFNIPVKKFCTGRPRAAAIVLPAMGTRADFYTPLAEEMAGRGFAVALPELPGTGASLPRPSRRVDYGYRDLVGNFLPALVELVRNDHPSTPIAVIGHSLGAHAGTLAAATGRIEVEALVTVAGGNIHYRNWIGAGALKVLSVSLLFSALAGLLGYLPGQYFGFGGPQAKTLIREWARIIQTGSFSHIAEIPDSGSAAPMLSIGIAGDTFAPEKSIAALAAVLGGKVIILPKSWQGNPHMSWVRQPVVTVDAMVEWFSETGFFRRVHEEPNRDAG
jgi:predicted alpha/beta hydrolase